ncbi:hypothetical protein D3C80_2120480 [compost metagenome]
MEHMYPERSWDAGIQMIQRARKDGHEALHLKLICMSTGFLVHTAVEQPRMSLLVLKKPLPMEMT